MPFVPLKPIPIKDRSSMVFVGMGRIDVRDGAFCVVDEVNGERMSPGFSQPTAFDVQIACRHHQCATAAYIVVLRC